MSLSPVDLCNLALSRAGGHRITQIAALGEATNEARHCAVKYPQARRVALRNHPWRFASRRAILAPTGMAPTGEGSGGFAYRYQYPGDCLQIREIQAHGVPRQGGDSALPFETELAADNTRAVVCDIPAAVLVYTMDIDDPNAWDSLFYDALAWQLGAELALTLGNDVHKAKFLEERARIAWDDARTADAREEQERRPVGGYVQARG